MNAPVAAGQVLAGKYRIERVLGHGGMGVVVAAMHQQLHQRVAIKFLLPGASDQVVQRFLREGRAAVRLKSEHVARVLDVGELEDGSPYMVMEYLEGEDLLQRIRARGALPIEDAVTYLIHACSAIAEAHAAGIIHRDLKPANLFLTTGSDGAQMVKVLDFGISKAALEATGGEQAGGEPQIGLTSTHAILGSPLYMSPEQMQSARSVDARADIWSMGAILYQLLTGRVPFETTSLAEIIMMTNTQEPPPPCLFRPELPEALEAAILRCLRKPREARFANVGELAVEIAPFASDEAQALLPKILRTLGMTGASSPGFPHPVLSRSSPSLPPISAPTPSTPTPAGPFDATHPSTRPAAPGAAATLPAAVARTAQAAGSTGSNPPDPLPTVAGWTAAGAGSGAPARRSTSGKSVAVALALLTLGGAGAFAMSRLGARTPTEEPAPPSTAEVAPMPTQATTPPPPAPFVAPVSTHAPSDAQTTPSGAPSVGPAPTQSAESLPVGPQAPRAPNSKRPDPKPAPTPSAPPRPTATEKDPMGGMVLH